MQCYVSSAVDECRLRGYLDIMDSQQKPLFAEQYKSLMYTIRQPLHSGNRTHLRETCENCNVQLCKDYSGIFLTICSSSDLSFCLSVCLFLILSLALTHPLRLSLFPYLSLSISLFLYSLSFFLSFFILPSLFLCFSLLFPLI